MTITLKKEHIFYLTVLIIAILLAAYMNGWFDKESRGTKPLPPTNVISMTQEEYNLVKDAINQVLKDIGKYGSLNEAIGALYAEMPISVRDNVIANINAKELSDLSQAIQEMLNRIKIGEAL